MFNFSVATINCRNRADRWRERRHLLIAQLLDAQPDLISLQELSMPIAQGRWIRNQLNARLPDRAPAYKLVQKRKHHLRNGYFEGIGILTNLPVLYSDFLPLGYGGRVALRVNVELPDRRNLDFVSVHLHHISYDKQARQEQAMRLTGWLRTNQPTPLQIIAGDFNELPNGPAIRYLKQTYQSAYERKHSYEPLATFPTALVPTKPDYADENNIGWSGCLDYIFLSLGKFQVVDATIFMDQHADEDATLYPSDHVGLLAKLRV